MAIFGGDNDITLTIKAKDDATSSINSVMNSVGKMAGAFAIGQVAVNAFNTVINAIPNLLSSSLDAYREAEMAQTRLTHIMQTSTGASQEQINVLLDQAEALEKVGVVSADTINVAQGTFATFDLGASSIQKLIPAFLDMVVAERGVNATTGDMISYANGLGQALQGNYQALTQRGFILDAATKKIIEHGTETQRVEAITKVMNSTYEGMNQTMRNTSEGAVKAATMTFSKMKEQLGAGLSPVLTNLTSSLMEVAQKMMGNVDIAQVAFKVFRTLTEVIWGLTNILIQAGAAFAKMLTYIAQASMTVLNFSKSVRQAFSEQREAIDKFADGSQESYDKFKEKNEEAEKSLQSISNTAKVTLPPIDKLLGNVKDSAEKNAQKISDALSKLKESLTRVRQSGADELEQLAKSHEESLQRSVEKIDELKKSLTDLSSKYNETAADAATAFSKQQADDAKGIGEAIVAQQNKIAELRKQAGYETDPQKRINLEEQIKKEEDAYTKNADFIKLMSSEVAEAKRRDALTEFERQIEDYKTKRLQAEQEYNDRRMDAAREYAARTAEIKKEIEQEQKKIAEENTRYNAAQLAITKILADAEAMRLNITKKSADEVVKLVDIQIDRYNKLAEAISRASQGKSPQLGSAPVPVTREFGGIVPGAVGTPVPIIAHGQEMVIPASKAGSYGTSQGSVTININNPSVRSDSDLNAIREMIEDAFRDVSRVHKLTTV